MQRFLAKAPAPPKPEKKAPGRAVVIGAGPAGLVAALHLQVRASQMALQGICDKSITPIGGRLSRRLCFSPADASSPLESCRCRS